MKIWSPLCVCLLCACGSSPNSDEPSENGGSHAGSTAGGGSAGKGTSGNKGGSGGESRGASDHAGASNEAAGKSAGNTEVGGSTGAGGKSGGGAGAKAGTGGDKSGAGGGKTGSGGSTAADAGKTGSGGSTGTDAGKTGSGGTAVTDASKPGSDVISGPVSGGNHVFLLLGQSNMAGYPKAKDSDKKEDARIQVLGFDDCAATGRKKDQWDTASPPLHDCGVGALGPGDWFSKTILSKYPPNDTIWLVPNAHSGEAIATLSQGGSHWDEIVKRAKLGQQKGPIEGMLFHQGESDCGNSQWPAAVKSMYDQLKSALSLTKDVPFLAGELPQDSKCSNHNPLVDKLPSVMGSFTYVVPSKGLTIDSADTQYHMHFDHDSQVTFGQRYADTMVTALGL